MRYSAGLVAICAVCCGGCTNFFPSFSSTNILAAPAHGDVIPLAEVENSVKCELGAFLSDHFARVKSETSKLQLEEGGDATIVLKVAVNSKGGVDYTEVDLDRGDLLTAILVAGGEQVKAPKLTLHGTGSVTATITLKMKQSALEPGFDASNCNRYDLTNNLANNRNPFSLNRLGVADWLSKFFLETWDNEIEGGPATYLDTIKLETKFLLVAELTSSFKRLITVVPINNFPLGTLKQDVTNELIITFKGKAEEKKKEKEDDPKEPSVSDCLLAEVGSGLLPEKCEKKLKEWRDKWAERPTPQPASFHSSGRSSVIAAPAGP